eukprot:SAG31_NODE_7809_length_1592_cov_0.941728_3_plen_270_part_00
MLDQRLQSLEEAVAETHAVQDGLLEDMWEKLLEQREQLAAMTAHGTALRPQEQTQLSDTTSIATSLAELESRLQSQLDQVFAEAMDSTAPFSENLKQLQHTASEIEGTTNAFAQSDLETRSAAAGARLSALAPMAKRHIGFGCDGCGKSPIIGCRYTKNNQNYDLCSVCFGKLDMDAEKAKFTAVESPAAAENAGLRNLHWAVVGVIFALMVATKPRDLPGVPGDVPGAPVIGHLFEIKGDVSGAGGWTAERCAPEPRLPALSARKQAY